ncbi:MAG: formyl transferase, partial [Novosphingobium sp.]
MPRRKDIWRCAIVDKSLEQLVAHGYRDAAVTWLPAGPEFTFLADPFGIRDGQLLHVFVEHYDYRSRHGTIERLTFDDKRTLINRAPALHEAWHLSYPNVFRAEGAIWMLPEAHRSGTLTLYRAHGHFDDWRAECTIALDCVPVDASVLYHQDRWWMFYTSAASKRSKVADLHLAWAERLTGPWTCHPGNPVQRDPSSSRPGGTPVVADGRVMLPVQDCTRSYGAAVRPLWIDNLHETTFSATAG